jgi:tetratricopeptide (TPR) repeat protein
MGINTYEVMYIQARDNYPYNVDECIEKLQYVIAADDEHAGAHCLMGQIYDEQLNDYKQAEYYYRMALYLDKEYTTTYYYYINLLINHNRLEEALKVIDKGLSVPGIDVATMYCYKGLLYEKYEMYRSATEYYTEAKKRCLNNYFINYLDEQLKRVKDKKALLKKSEKKDSKKSKKRDSSN